MCIYIYPLLRIQATYDYGHYCVLILYRPFHLFPGLLPCVYSWLSPLLLRPPAVEKPIYRVHVQAPIVELGPDPRKDDMGLFNRAAQHARVQRHAVRLHAIIHVHTLEAAQLLQRRVPGPGPQRHLHDLLLHVDEAGLLHPALVKAAHVERLAELRAHTLERLAPFERARHRRVVVCVDPRVILLHLDVRARLEVVVGLLVQLVPVGRAAAQRAPVDVVELADLGELPRLLVVVDVELDVGRHEARLNGRQVGADDQRAGELVRELDGPDARARADVEHRLRV